MNLPDYVKNCIDMLERSGFSAYAVGGAVRDGLLGKEPSDFDVTTSATPLEILRVFADYRTIETGIKHGTVTVLFENGEGISSIEVTTFRIDGEYLDSRHPESVSFSRDLLDDLSRRDFTVNAMAYNEREGIVDAFGGMRDLQDRVIRAVGEPKKRFCEDALRILRAFRFSAQLGFEIEYDTLFAAYECAPLLKNIARERIAVELKRMLACADAPYALKKMVDGGVWQAIFEAPAPSDELIGRIKELENGNFALRFAAIVSEMTEDERERVILSLRLSNDEKKLISRLCRARGFKPEAENEACARRFLHLYGDILEDSIAILCFFEPDRKSFANLIRIENEKKHPLSISSLALKGSDILPLCGGEHRRVGELLNMLLDRVMEDPTLNEKQTLLEIVKKSV